MTPDDLVVATEAHDYPLTLDHLLHTALTVAPAREIVDGSRGRYDYRELRRRIARLAAGLASLGVTPGETVAVMDWDSPRYLECFFAIPMMGAVLHTINVRLSPEQILYTINHAEDDVILVHEDFVPLIAQIRDRIDRMPKLVLVRDDDGAPMPDHGLDFAADYRSLLDLGGDGYEFPGARRAHPRHDVLHHGDHRRSQGRVVHPPPARAAHPRRARRRSRAAAATRGCTATTSTCRSPRCSTSTPGACPSSPPCSGSSRSIPVATTPRRCCGSSSAKG